MSDPTPRIAIIGAGMAGLTAARALADAGSAVTIFEKSRGIGGRLATRRVRAEGPAFGLEFDHGAPAIDAQPSSFRRFVEELRREGAAAAWPAAGADAFVGAPRMNALLAPAATGLDIRFSTRVSSVRRDGACWRLSLEDEDAGPDIPSVDAVIVTAPAPQTSGLLKTADDRLARAADAAAMAPCWTLMLSVDGAIDAAPILDRFDAASPIERIISDNFKPGRDSQPRRFVIHANAEWSSQNLDLPREEAAELLTKAALRAVGGDNARIIYAAAHRWRYARATRPIGAPILSSEDGTLIAAGDWLIGDDAGAAFQSGRAAAEAAISHFQR